MISPVDVTLPPAPATHGSAAPQPDVLEVLRTGLAEASERLASLDVPVPPMEGKLLRPLFALAMVPRSRWSELDVRFWSGALAVQMVHEASLLHDDVIDSADVRRGVRTVASRHGAARAVVLGDHYLTGAYRAAALTGSFEFLARFTEAVERTVAGEVRQGRSVGDQLSTADYDAIITGKSGELFGIAGALGATVLALPHAGVRYELGRSFGNLYQRIDDLLDFCTGATTGKPPLQDYRHGKWSWVLDLARVDHFALDDGALLGAVFGPAPDGPSPARQALELLFDRRRCLLRQAARVNADLPAIDGLLRLCVDAAVEGVAQQEETFRPGGRAGEPRVSAFATSATGHAEGMTATHGTAGNGETSSPGITGNESASPRGPAGHDPSSPRDAEDDAGKDDAARVSRGGAESVVRRLAEELGGPRAWADYFGEHARTFRLAARLFPPKEAGLVTGLYAYCRFTDDLVDDPVDQPSRAELRRRLDAWRGLSLAAWEGEETGIALLDSVLRGAAERGVARLYPEALLDGVAMDLEPRSWRAWSDLERYTFGVAGAVGGWMTQLFGLDDPELLEQAHALGHGMQLTNIARDVGEDWERGRVYLPAELLARHGLGCTEIDAMVDGRAPISEAYRAAIQELLERADRWYELAWPGIRALPPFFRRPVAAAASAYRGIHREIRRNGYDNLTRRAHTSTARKVLLAGAGLLDARRAS